LFVILVVFFLSYCFIYQLKHIEQTSVKKLDEVLLEKNKLEQVQYLSLTYQLAMGKYYRQPNFNLEEEVSSLSNELSLSVNQLRKVKTISELRKQTEQQLLGTLEESITELFSLKKVIDRQIDKISEVHIKRLIIVGQKKQLEQSGVSPLASAIYAIKFYFDNPNSFQIESVVSIDSLVSKLEEEGGNNALNSVFNNAIDEFEQAIFGYSKNIKLLQKQQAKITQQYQQFNDMTSSMLLNIDATYLQAQRINKDNIDEAKIMTWLLGSLSIILIALYGWYLRNQLINPLKEMSQLAQLFGNAQFKELLALNRKTKKSMTKRKDELGVIGQVFVDQSRYQQKMIFDIDTTCQSLIMGFLSQKTSLEYHGEYRLIEHTLNRSKDYVEELIKDIEFNCRSISQGEFARSTNASLYLGEYAPLQEGIEALKSQQSAQINDIVKVTQSIESGHSDVRRFVDPSHCYFGANQKIQQQLEQAINYLRDSAQYNFDQNWLKSGLSELNRKMTGEQPLAVLTKSCIDFIADYFQAPIGYIYRQVETQGKEKSVCLIAHYGILIDHKSNANCYQSVYSEGEGLIGQVFIEPEITVKKLTQDERQPIKQSGIAEAILSYVVVIPLIHEERIEGVLELGLYEPLTHIQREFLLHVVNNLGIAMNVAISRDQINILLAQSQRQAEELEVQQAKLGNSNDMLMLKAKELEEKQEAVERKNQQLEQASFVMEEKAKELALASRYKSEFLANMSHELRSPLNSLLILSKLLVDNSKQHLDEKEVNYAQVIYRSGTDLMQLIEDILDLSRIEAGKTDINYADVPLGEIVRRIYQRFTPTALENNLDFIYSYENAPEMVNIDEKRVVQIITNLLSNAFKFTESGSVNLIVEDYSVGEIIKDSLEESISLAYDALCFRIEDTGIGIAPENRDRVFQAFQQADGTTSRKYGGTGLGLTITQHLVKLMGGDIYFHSELSEGSQFIVYLPLKPIAGKAISTGSIIGFENVKSDDEKSEENVFGSQFAIASEPIGKHNFESAPDTANKADKETVLYIGQQAIALNLSKTIESLGFKIESKRCEKQDYLTVSKHIQPRAIVFDSSMSTDQIESCQLQLNTDLHTRDIAIHHIEIENDANSPSGDRGVILQIADQLDKCRLNSQQRIILCSDNTAFIQRLSEYYPAILIINEPFEILEQLEKNKEYSQSLDNAVLVIDSANKLSLSIVEQLTFCDSKKAPSIIYFTLDALDQQQQKALDTFSTELCIKTITKAQVSVVKLIAFLESLTTKGSDDYSVLINDYFTQTNILEGKKMLIVDDNISNVFALSAILETYKVSYLIADNGAQALNVLNSEEDIDLILMDIMMPELDGYQAMEKIRELSKYKDTPILALTAKAMPEDRNKCINAGASDYMTKPLDAQKLVAMMNMWLATSSKNIKFSEIN
jgi:signal transduction histidine kinase/CheY-like chemotaxis protein